MALPVVLPVNPALPEMMMDLYSAMADGAHWSADALGLYGTLAKEGLGFVVDVYGGEEGSGVVPIAEAWDRRINAMAHAHAAFSQEHAFGAMATFDQLALWFAGNDPGKKMLLKHYIWGQGSPRKLTVEEMRGMRTFLDFFDTEATSGNYPYAQELKSAVDEAKRGKAVGVQGTVAGANDALGNFTVKLQGVLRPAAGTPQGDLKSPNPIKALATPSPALMFEGRMAWKDFWDFDPKVAARFTKSTGSGRPVTAEMAVDAVAALVDGVPFDVLSDTVQVLQYSGRAPVY